MNEIIRHIDELGRVVIPASIRKALLVDTGSEFYLRLEGNKIVMEKLTSDENILRSVSELEFMLMNSADRIRSGKMNLLRHYLDSIKSTIKH